MVYKKRGRCCKQDSVTVQLEEVINLRDKEDAKPEQEEEGPQPTGIGRQGSPVSRLEVTPSLI